MVKNFKYFRMQFGGKQDQSKENNGGKSTYRHSMYMQSKDSTWISRNTSDEEETAEINDKE